MEKEEKKQMAKDSVDITYYETLFKQEFALFVDLREEWKNAKTKVKKKYVAKKLEKQKVRALDVGAKLATLKERQEKMEAENEE